MPLLVGIISIMRLAISITSFASPTRKALVVAYHAHTTAQLLQLYRAEIYRPHRDSNPCHLACKLSMLPLGEDGMWPDSGSIEDQRQRSQSITNRLIDSSRFRTITFSTVYTSVWRNDLVGTSGSESNSFRFFSATSTRGGAWPVAPFWLVEGGVRVLNGDRFTGASRW